jgi:hypothetical protein
MRNPSPQQWAESSDPPRPLFSFGEKEMTSKQIEALRKKWEQNGGKIIEIKEGEPTFNATEFIESLSYSKTPQEKLET